MMRRQPAAQERAGPIDEKIRCDLFRDGALTRALPSQTRPAHRPLRFLVDTSELLLASPYR